MTTKEDLTTNYFCPICIDDLKDNPKVLKEYRPDIYLYIFYCGNCENHFLLNRENEPKRLTEDFKKWFYLR